MSTCQPNYKRIYTDILNKKFSHKKTECQKLLRKQKLSALDLIELNKIIYGQNTDGTEDNQKHRSYSSSDIIQMLDYQKKYKLNNTQLANHFKLSRNTVAKWIKDFDLK